MSWFRAPIPEKAGATIRVLTLLSMAFFITCDIAAFSSHSPIILNFPFLVLAIAGFCVPTMLFIVYIARRYRPDLESIIYITVLLVSFCIFVALTKVVPADTYHVLLMSYGNKELSTLANKLGLTTVSFAGLVSQKIPLIDLLNNCSSAMTIYVSKGNQILLFITIGLDKQCATKLIITTLR